MQLRGTTSSVIYRGSRPSQHAKFEKTESEQKISEQDLAASVSDQRRSKESMDQVHSRVSMIYRQSKVAIAMMNPRQSRVSTGPRRSTVARRSTVSFAQRPSFTRGRQSKVSTDFEGLFSQMSSFHDHGKLRREEESEFKTLTKYFMGFWEPQHAVAALSHLEALEMKRIVRALQKKYGQWCPPPEVAQALKPHTHSPHSRTRLPDTKDARNLQFVLNMLGCSLHENRPYNQFLKAKTVRQKRLWMYKYMTPTERFKQVEDYSEPICTTRLKRLYHFFPDRFKEQNNSIYFNNKLVTYNESKRVFYFGVTPAPSSDQSD